ncbi:MAG: sugar phosphate isomerase/epimerase family protein [Planctomycetota bacterium]
MFHGAIRIRCARARARGDRGRGVHLLKAALEKAGLTAVALWPELSPVDPDTAEALGTVLEQAKAIGAAQVWISGPEAFDEGGELRPDEEWEKDVAAFASNAGALSARAKELGLALAVPTEARLAGCAADMEKLFSATLDAEVKLAYNPGLVSYFTGVNPKRDLESVLDRVGALCVRDHSGAVGEANFPPAGGGEVDYIEILTMLKGRGFAGPVVVEHLPDGTPEELDDSAKRAARFLGMVLKQ